MRESRSPKAMAEERPVVFKKESPVSVEIYQARRQMPHYHLDSIELIMCIRGSVDVYSMHVKHTLHEGDIMETDTYDIHSVTASDDKSDNLVASFHFDFSHPLFAGDHYNLIYYVCASDSTDAARRPALNNLRRLLWALLLENCRFTTLNLEACKSGERTVCRERIVSLSQKVLQTLRSGFQYFNSINLDYSYSENMQSRFEHILAYMLDNYADKITMGQICEMEHINYNYLSQFFKTTSLKTFRNFLHEIRVYHSEHLLLCHPEITVPEVGYACGFSDPKFFYREFRKEHGHTPHQHRIWYRNYNRYISDDLQYNIADMRSEIEQLVADFFSRDLCEGL